MPANRASSSPTVERLARSARRARDAGCPGGRCGSIVYVQRFPSDLRLDVHYHAIVLDGVYTGFESPDKSLRFHPAAKLTDDEVTWLVGHIAVLVTGHLRRGGYLDDDLVLIDESGEDLDEEASHQAAQRRRTSPVCKG